MAVDGAGSAALAAALDGVLESADALGTDSLDAELHDESPSIASRATVDIATRLVNRYIGTLTLRRDDHLITGHHADDQRRELKFRYPPPR